MSSQKKFKVKAIEYLGEKYIYTSPENLANKIKVSKSTAERLIKDYKNKKTDRYITFGNSDIVKINLKKPLIAQQFSLPMTNNKLITGGSSVGSKVIIGGVSSTPVNLNIYVRFSFMISVDVEIRTTNFTGIFKPNQITDEWIKNKIQDEYLNDIDFTTSDLKILDVKIVSKYSDQEFDFKNMKLFFNNDRVLNLDAIFSNITYNKTDEDCVVDFLKRQYPSKSKKKIESVRTIDDIQNWSSSNNINLNIYDISKNVICTNHVTGKNKFKNLNILAFNNHLYPIDGKTLKNTQSKKIELVYVENVFDKFVEIIKDHILPTDIRFGRDNIKSFVVDNIRYFENDEYERCMEILALFIDDEEELEKTMYPSITLGNIGHHISKIFEDTKSYNSFLPNSNKFVKGGYNYHNKEIEDIDLQTIDKNKSYTNSLRTLPYLLKTDIRHNKHVKFGYLFDCNDIVNDNLYIAKPKYSSILLPVTSVYTGYFLRMCLREELEFQILEELECDRMDNVYKLMIDKLNELVQTKLMTDLEFKTIMNIFIGRFESSNHHHIGYEYEKFCNADEGSRSSGHKIPININTKRIFTYNGETCSINGTPTHYIIQKQKDQFKLYNKKPIAIQIKDNARLAVYEQMKRMNINLSHIKQIKTDSITFVNKDDKFREFINKDLDGWKEEDFKSIQNKSYVDKMVSFEYEHEINKNVIYDCYAGAGKTTLILDYIIPKMNDDYIVLTPSHASITDYRKAGKNCKVIQTYYFGCELPKAKNIIVDEIGMVDKLGWDFIFKCHLLGKRIICFGDTKQLKPVSGNICNKPLFLDMIFSHQQTINTNYRNNFTKRYYDKLISSRDPEFLSNCVSEHSTPWEKSDVIICYRNLIVDKYNTLKSELLGFNSVKDVGAKIRCVKNHKSLTQHGIYNNFVYTVHDRTDTSITLFDGFEYIEISLTHKLLFCKYFQFAYATTLYGIQGQTINSYHFPLEDEKFINGRSAYTTISRLKQKLEQPQIDKNIKNQFYRK